MSRSLYQPILRIAAAAIGLWLCVRYLLPVSLPFLLGAALAFGAEPLVRLLRKKLPGGIASFLGVSSVLILLLAVMTVALASVFRQLGSLAQALPDLEQAATQGLSTCEGFLVSLADKTPKGIRPVLKKGVNALFQNGNAIVGKAVEQVPSIASSLISGLASSALTVGTGVLGAYFLSARLPKLRAWAQSDRARPWYDRIVPTLQNVRHALACWLKAQGKLCLVSFLLLLAGLLLLRIPLAPLWAFLIALVDAIPLLGTGTVLVPWALVCFFQGQTVKAVGLLGLFTVTALTRSTLEPKLVGKHLGLDPLMTLAALYAGYRFWGIGGMLLSPIACVVLRELVTTPRQAG